MIGTALELHDVDLPWRDLDATHASFDRRESERIGRAQRVRETRQQLLRAWRLMLESQCKDALLLVAAMSSRLDELDASSAERYRKHVRLIRAVGSAMTDDPEALFSELAVLEEPAFDRRPCRLTRLLLRFGNWRLARWSDVYKTLPSDRARSRSDVIAHTLDLTVLAVAALDKLHLITASRFAADAMAIAHRAGLDGSVGAASAAVVLASVRYELGYVDHAEELLIGRLPILGTSGTADSIIRAYWLLTRIAQHRSRYIHAAVVLNEGQHVGELRSSTRIVLTLMGERVRMLLSRDAVEQARREAIAMENYARTHDVAPSVRQEITELCALANLRVAQAEAGTNGAVKTLEGLVRTAAANNRLHAAFHLRLELAEALSNDREDEGANRLLLQLLEQGEHLGMLQCWVDAGPSCGRLLMRMARQPLGTSSVRLSALDPYLRTILEHRTSSETVRPVRRNRLHACERLSARERTVLALIAQGKSNKRVAQLLQVTPETIKSHLKRVFVKLGAKSRAEAVSRAANFGQLIDAVLPHGPEQERVSLDKPPMLKPVSIRRPNGEGRPSPARDGSFRSRAVKSED